MAVWRSSKAGLMEALARLPAALAGTDDPAGIGAGFRLRLGVALLSQVQQDFVVKSRGGTGRDGIAWKPLDPKTVARRRLGKGDKKAVSLKSRAAALTAAQRRKVEKDVQARAARLMLKDIGHKQALGLARAQAEASYRAAGKIASKQSVLGSRSVEMLRDTGRLFRSLQPGIADRPSGAEGQVFRSGGGEVVVGSEVVYARRQHEARPFWPADGFPAAWLPALYAAALRGAARAIELLLKGV